MEKSADSIEGASTQQPVELSEEMSAAEVEEFLNNL